MQTTRLDGVDTLRGLSILAVILLHIPLRMRIAGFSFESAFRGPGAVSQPVAIQELALAEQPT